MRYNNWVPCSPPRALAQVFHQDLCGVPIELSRIQMKWQIWRPRGSMTFAASLKHIPVRLDTTLQRKRESEHTSYRLFFLPCTYLSYDGTKLRFLMRMTTCKKVPKASPWNWNVLTMYVFVSLSSWDVFRWMSMILNCGGAVRLRSPSSASSRATSSSRPPVPSPISAVAGAAEEAALHLPQTWAAAEGEQI